MPDKPLRGWTIIFDLDGTLIDTAPDLLNAMNHVLVQFGLKTIDEDNIRSMVGQGARAIMSKGFAFYDFNITEKQFAVAVDDFIDFYSENLDIDSQLFPFIIEALDGLIALGATLCVATNKAQKTTDKILESFDISNRFKVAFGPESVSKNKPSGVHLIETLQAVGGNKRFAVMVGDSKTDEAAALDAQIPYFHYPHGYNSSPLEDCPSHVQIDSFEQLVPSVLRLAKQKTRDQFTKNKDNSNG